MLASSIMGVRPTAMHTVSASSTFSVPGTGWKWSSSTSSTFCTPPSPVTRLMVWDR